MEPIRNKQRYFDEGFSSTEQFPRSFSVNFEAVDDDQVRVSYGGGNQLGDIINDNAYQKDFYRFHDIFHYSFATFLGWSPCARAMMKRKRKSDPQIDQVEDGARAAITEEAISMIIFNEAKRKGFFEQKKRVSRTTLRIIREMTENFEVSVRTNEEWEEAILSAYTVFRSLVKNNGGCVDFDLDARKVHYSSN